MRNIVFVLFSIQLFIATSMAQISPDKIASPISPSISQNGTIFISGKIGTDGTSGKLKQENFETEVHRAMQNIGAVLKGEGLTYGDLVNVTVYLKDMSHYEVLNRVYRGYFTDRFPARECLAVKDLTDGANVEISAMAAAPRQSKEIVRLFLEEVRSGLHPEKAATYMADTVLAHQVTSEKPTTVQRTPANYTAHVKEFITLFGNFEFTITELLADGDRVYARWIQKGTHKADIDQFKATGLPLVEYTSAVYRIEHDKIVEYWLQSDRLGFEKQLKQNMLHTSGKATSK